MSDTDRVRAWRDRLKQAGRVPMTIWVTAETKARYEDLALTYHRSPSELAQQALDAYRPTPASGAEAGTNTEQLRTLIQAELAQLAASVTDTVTATVTATLLDRLPHLVPPTLSSRASVTEADTETVTMPGSAVRAPRTATATDTETDTPPPAYDPSAAVDRIETLRRQGLSLTAIAAQLTAEGIRTRYGLPWQHSSVRHLLKTHGRSARGDAVSSSP